ALCRTRLEGAVVPGRPPGQRGRCHPSRSQVSAVGSYERAQREAPSGAREGHPPPTGGTDAALGELGALPREARQAPAGHRHLARVPGARRRSGQGAAVPRQGVLGRRGRGCRGVVRGRDPERRTRAGRGGVRVDGDESCFRPGRVTVSWWVSLERDGKPVSVPRFVDGGTFKVAGSDTAELNITYNYGDHYGKHLDEQHGLRWIDGRQASECVQRL